VYYFLWFCGYLHVWVCRYDSFIQMRLTRETVAETKALSLLRYRPTLWLSDSLPCDKCCPENYALRGMLVLKVC
jgi:hypothetical protein